MMPLTIGAAVVLSTAAAAAPFLAGAPPGFTGGWGEAHSGQCHYGSAVGDPEGSLTIAGLPHRYAAGQTYAFTVTLRHPVLERGGFQIAARFRDGALAGSSAGILKGDPGRVPTLSTSTNPVIAYLTHTDVATKTDTPHLARWRLAWTAPESADTPVMLYVAANAANGDDSPFGDVVYVDSVRIPGATPSAR